MDGLKTALDNIDVEDLEYVERDLCFNELASIALLLYGEERTTAEFALQKLIISNAHNARQDVGVPRNLLSTFALKINPTNWRNAIVEALSVISARRVLRKLGFKWETVRQHYLPHVTELSLHLHPLLKALYKICDDLTPTQAGHLILYMNQHHRPKDHFPFYDSGVLEVFILDWITLRIINVGDHKGNGACLHVLFEYFKLNELENMKSILISTLRQSGEQNAQDANSHMGEPVSEAISDVNKSPLVKSSESSETRSNRNAQHQEFDRTEKNDDELNDCYKVHYDSAGIVLIINEKEFYAETDPEFQHLLPKPQLKVRQGTDVDKEKLIETFTSYGYKAVVAENLKHTEILDTIGNCAKRSISFDSFVCCILSHGFKGNVYGSNSIPVSIVEIEEKLTAEALKDKPKLLIIQACQNSSKDANETKRKKSCPKEYADILTVMDSNEAERKKSCSKEYADILKAMATVPGFLSIRHTHEGSWFIQSLCNAIIRLSDKKHLIDILTAVINEVSTQKGEEAEQVMIPQCISTLRLYFRLPPRKKS